MSACVESSSPEDPLFFVFAARVLEEDAFFSRALALEDSRLFFVRGNVDDVSVDVSVDVSSASSSLEAVPPASSVPSRRVCASSARRWNAADRAPAARHPPGSGSGLGPVFLIIGYFIPNDCFCSARLL